MPPKHEDSIGLERARNIIAESHHLLVAVDSNAFFEGTDHSRRISFNRNWMGKFRRLAAQGEKLLMSAVWDIEVKRHFSRSIDSQVEVKLPKFAKIGLNSVAISDLNRRATALSQDAQALVEREWDSVKSSFNTQIIEVPKDPGFASEVFRLWASNAWPFEQRKEKRDEFPDAFALLSLVAYVEELRTKPNFEQAAILVVTADRGCRNFCAETKSLIPCSNIDAAIDLLEQRQEILRLVRRSVEISIVLEDSNHVLFERLRESFSFEQQTFPPPCFSFIIDGHEKSGWLRTFNVKSISLLPIEPHKRKINITTDQDGSINFTGRVRIELTISLNEPSYTANTACPSNEVILSDQECSLEANFTAGSNSHEWYARITEIHRQLNFAP